MVLGLRAGDAEEWLLVNPEATNHPFHIHVNPFLVKEVHSSFEPRSPFSKAVAASSVGAWRDTVVVPPFSSMRIWLRFSGHHGFTGKTVFHCHFLAHEDTGMIHNLMIEAPLGKDAKQHLRSVGGTDETGAGDGGAADAADGSRTAAMATATFLPFLAPLACAVLLMAGLVLKRRVAASAKRGAATVTRPQPASAGEGAESAASEAGVPVATDAETAIVAAKVRDADGRVML